MEKRYHKEVGFNHRDYTELKEICQRFNDSDEMTKSIHALEKMKLRFDMFEVLTHLANIEWNYKDIFEYYTEGEKVKRMCFRSEFNATEDIIIVIDRNKNLVTMWAIDKANNKANLDKSVYQKV